MREIKLPCPVSRNYLYYVVSLRAMSFFFVVPRYLILYWLCILDSRWGIYCNVWNLAQHRDNFPETARVKLGIRKLAVDFCKLDGGEEEG